ncbi:MAG: sigma-70 family RNA polymerase sigma factor [Spirochaetales bacterium]|nr:sigma-70 family RNA polymerase sigma factor [Spirochaetales bacterium]
MRARASEMQNDDQQFEEMYRRWYAPMAVFASSFSRLPAMERETMAHDMLVHAWFERSSYDPARPFKAWLYRVARNYAIDRIRSSPPPSAPFDDSREARETETRRDAPDAEFEKNELLRTVRQTILSLPERDRQIAHLAFYEELDSKEIGKILSLPSGTVRWRIGEIRKILRTAVQK